MTRYWISVLIWVFLTASPCQLQMGFCGTALTCSLKRVLPYRQVQWSPYYLDHVCPHKDCGPRVNPGNSGM